MRGLSQQQREILDLCASGFSNKEIAKLLRVTDSTIAQHIYRARRKLGIPANIGNKTLRELSKANAYGNFSFREY